MNPYMPPNNPRLVTTVERARTLIKQFNAETAILVANKAEAEDNFNATLAVMVERNPDLKQSLDELAFGARVMGEIEGFRTDADRMKSQYIAALPIAIQQQLP